MKAEYILRALEAMERAENFALNAPGKKGFQIYLEVQTARIALQVYSQIDELEIEVEK